MWTLEITIMLLMVAINGVFAAYEIALASVSVARLQVLAQEGRAGAGAALFMKRNMEASLAVVQLGITLAGAVAAATGGAGAEETIAPWLQRRWNVAAGLAELLAIAAVVLPLTALTIMCGELVPKVFALRNKEWVCLRLSPAMRGFSCAVWPAVWLFETGVTTVMRFGAGAASQAAGKTESAELQELRASAALARASRLIGAREEHIILGAARLSSKSVQEIMLPAEHMVMFALQDAAADCLITAHLDMHTRFPVAESRGDPQTVVGYVNFKDLVAMLRLSPHDASVRAVVRPIPDLAATAPIANCMEQMIREHSHIALVRDAAGRVLGMITMEDILEELVGDLQDEYDRLPTHALRTGSSWIVGGGIGPGRLQHFTGIDVGDDFTATGSRNLNEWVVHHLGKPVRGGEVLERQGIRVVVRKVRRQKVLEAQLGATTLPADGPGKQE